MQRAPVQDHMESLLSKLSEPEEASRERAQWQPRPHSRLSPMTLPLPAAIPDGMELRISSKWREPRPGYEAEEMGALSVIRRDTGDTVEEYMARYVLGAKVGGNGDTLQVFLADFGLTEQEQQELRAHASADAAIQDGGVAPKGAWHRPVKKVKTLKYNLTSATLALEWADVIKSWANPVKRTIYVIVNPHSGKGKGKRVWEKVIEPALRATPHEVELYYTTGPGDATRYCKHLAASTTGQPFIVASVGGDGSMSEALNGLMQREDARRGDFTISFLPAGTSNSMAHMAGSADPLTAAWALAKGRRRTMDLFAVHQGEWDQGVFHHHAGQAAAYGFLGVYGALIADLDIDSEGCRCMGEARYTAYAVVKIFGCACCGLCAPVHSRIRYNYRIRYLKASQSPVDSVSNALDKSGPPRVPTLSPCKGDWQEWSGDLQFFHLNNAPALSGSMMNAKNTKLDDGSLNLQWMVPMCRPALVPQFDKLDTSAHILDVQTGEKKSCTKLATRRCCCVRGRQTGLHE